MKFFFDKYEFTSGGALGSLTLGLVVKELWRRRLPGPLASQVGSVKCALLSHDHMCCSGLQVAVIGGKLDAAFPTSARVACAASCPKLKLLCSRPASGLSADR